MKCQNCNEEIRIIDKIGWVHGPVGPGHYIQCNLYARPSPPPPSPKKELMTKSNNQTINKE